MRDRSSFSSEMRKNRLKEPRLARSAATLEGASPRRAQRVQTLHASLDFLSSGRRGACQLREKTLEFCNYGVSGSTSD